MTFGMALAALTLGMYLGYLNATYAKAYAAVTGVFTGAPVAAGLLLVVGATILGFTFVTLLSGDPFFVGGLPFQLQILTGVILAVGWLPTFFALRFYAHSRESGS